MILRISERMVAAAACLLALAGVSTLGLRATPAAASSVIAEAESLQAPSEASDAFDDPTASGGKVLGLWATTAATGKVSLPAEARELVVRARGEQCEGMPELHVRVDGLEVGRFVVTATGWGDHRVAGQWAPGEHDVVLAFPNDRVQGCDRNLVLDRVELVLGPGTPVKTAAAPPAAAAPAPAVQQPGPAAPAVQAPDGPGSAGPRAEGPRAEDAPGAPGQSAEGSPPPAALPMVPSPRLPQSKGTRDVRRWPYSSTSPWNMPIGRQVQFAAPGDPRNVSLTDRRISTAVNAGVWSIPVVQAAPGDPVATVTPRYVTSTRSDYGGWIEPPAGYSVRYRIPASARPDRQADAHLMVIDPTGRYVDETWSTRRTSDTSWTAGYHGRNDLFGSGVGVGARAGGTAFGGLIRTWELRSGSIRHALAIALTPQQMSNGHVWPAAWEDGGPGESGPIPMGTHVAIPLDVDLRRLNLSPAGLTVAKALQRHGAFVMDRADNVGFSAEPSLEGDPRMTALRGDIERIRQQLRVVTNSGPNAVGGPGPRVAPLAPEPAR